MSLLLLLGGAEVAVGGVTGTATWDQEPATWAATGSEEFTATASFLQAAAAWDAEATESIPATATFSQVAAAWSAAGIVAADITSTATFTQGKAAWLALASTPVVEEETRYGRTVRAKPYRLVLVKRATFEQAPASWSAEMMSVIDDKIEELILAGVL